MTSLSARRQQERQDAERSINLQAEVISLRRKAAEWGADEDEETISSLAGRWEALSNWFPASVVMDGVSYPSVEHAFQAAKAGDDAEAAKAIRIAPNAQAAHELGRKLPTLPDDWERRKRPLMIKLLRDKFRRDAALRERLLKTDNRNLVATNEWGETYWGVSGGKGSNELGKALTAVRVEIQAGADTEPWLRDAFALCDEETMGGKLTLEVKKAGAIVETVPLGSAPLTYVGKHSSCEIQLEHPSVSRKHACVLWLKDKPSGPSVVDLASKAGVTINGRRVPPLIAAGPLKDGTEIVFGGSSRTYVVRIEEVDVLEKLRQQHLKLQQEIQTMETDASDSANLFGLVAQERRIDHTMTTCFFGNLPYESTEQVGKEPPTPP